jgi:hypothetical protein
MTTSHPGSFGRTRLPSPISIIFEQQQGHYAHDYVCLYFSTGFNGYVLIHTAKAPMQKRMPTTHREDQICTAPRTLFEEATRRKHTCIVDEHVELLAPFQKFRRTLPHRLEQIELQLQQLNLPLTCWIAGQDAFYYLLSLYNEWVTRSESWKTGRTLYQADTPLGPRSRASHIEQAASS